MMVRKKYGEGHKNANEPKQTTPAAKHGRGSVIAWEYMGQ